MTVDIDALRRLVRDIPDYPKPGVVFKDITPLLAEPEAFRAALDAVAAPFAGATIHKVLGVEARGFVFAAPVALAHGAGFVPVRKAGKLPHEIEQEEYELEYGTDLLEIHRDAIHAGEQVVVVDDVLATGGTAAAVVRLARRLGAEVLGCTFLVELEFLAGRKRLDGVAVHSVVRYS